MVTGNGRRVTSPERNWIENARAPPLQGNKPRQSCHGAAGCKSSRSVTANSQSQARIEPDLVSHAWPRRPVRRVSLIGGQCVTRIAWRDALALIFKDLQCRYDFWHRLRVFVR